MKKSTSKKLVDAKLKIEAASALDRHQIGYQARALVLATLPHKKTAENFYKRSNGSFNLELSQNTAKVGLPYGYIPRLLLAYMATEAVKHYFTQRPSEAVSLLFNDPNPDSPQ